MRMTKDIIVAGGCFWCVENDLDKIPEVINVESGYAGGESLRPTYENHEGHREAVRVVYDPEKTKLYDILYHFIKHIDPTDSEGQFHDRGFAYTPAIFVKDVGEQKIAEQVLEDIAESGKYDGEIVVPIISRGSFWPAEEYSQDYAKKNPEQYNRYKIASGRADFIEKHK